MSSNLNNGDEASNENQLDLENMVHKLKSENENISKEYNEIIHLLGRFNEEIFNLHDSMQLTLEKNSEFEAQIEIDRKKKEEYKITISRLEHVKEILELRIKQLQEDFQQTKQIHQMNEQLKFDNYQLEEKIKRFQKEITFNNEQIETIQNQNNELQKMLSQNNELINNKANEQFQQFKEALSEKLNIQAIYHIFENYIQQTNVIKDNFNSEQTFNVIKEGNGQFLDIIVHVFQIISEMTGIDLNFNDATQLIKQSNEQITKMYLDNIGKSVNDDNSDFIQKLNERTKEYINIIGPLNSEIFDIRTDSNTLYETYLSTKSSLNEIQTKLDNLDKENGTLKIAIEDKNNQIEYLQTELNKKNTENAKLIETNQSTTGDLKSEIYKLFTELEERRSRDGEIKGIETERTQMINDIGSFEVQIYELQTQLNNTQNQNSLLLKQISEIREEKETQKNQFLYEIEKERTKSIETENLKWKIESLIKEKEIILQRIASDKEVREAIEQLKTENENLKTQKINLEKQLQISRIEHKQLTNSISNSENIEIRRLEDEKLELLSRISVLESQIQLKSVKQKDAEMALLEKQLQQKQKEFNELQNNFSNLQTENLKLTKEIEKNKEEINQSDLKCSELEYQLEKSQNKEQETILKNEIERLQNEINVFDLKHEQIQHELESSQKENEELHQKINIHIENEKTLHEMLSNTQLQTTQSDTTNIINRAQIIKLNQKISELEAIIRSLQSNKEELLNTISENNIRHKHELDILSQSIQSVDNNKAQIEIVTTLNTKIIDLTNKSKQYLSQYQNESADHYNTKQNLIKSEANYSELSQRYRNIECDYSCLIESLTKLFKCMPSTSSIITAATRASKTCESYNNIIENNKKLENELRKANQMPNFLNYRLKQTEFCLELERKKCDVLNLKLNSSKTQKQNLTFAADFLLNVIEKASDKNIKSMASILLSKVDTNDGSDSELWNEFASMLLTPKVDVKQVEGLLRIKIEEKLQIMNRIMEKIQKLDNNFNDVKSKIGFYKAKKEHKKKIISKYKPPSTPKNIGSLYERSLKPRTPLPVHNDLEGTPFQNRKPFRVPLTAIKSSYENTDYSNNALGKKSSLKLPKHNSPYGVNPIPARSYY